MIPAHHSRDGSASRLCGVCRIERKSQRRSVSRHMAGTNETQSMIHLVRELITLLSRDALGVEEIAARIGPVIRDPGISMALEMQPAAGMRSARLSRDPETGIPYVLTIEPEPGVRPTVAELK